MQEVIIQPHSAEWIYVNFRLQLLLAQPNVHLISLKKREPIFPSVLDGYLKIDAAIDVTDMDQPTCDSIKGSLRKEVLLKTGRIIQNTEGALGKRYRMLLMKAAISQILPAFKERTLSTSDYLEYFREYDSIYVAAHKQEVSIFNHEYLVKESYQYQWEYDVEYSYEVFDQWNADNVLCQNCKVVPAKFFCLEDKESYCWPCFGDLHRSDKKARHRKQPLSPYNCPPLCPKSLHQSQALTHYCFNCKQLKCSNCLSDGQHRKGTGVPAGEVAHETIQSRQLAFLFKNKEQDMVKEIKEKISMMIKEVQAKIQLISQHYDLRLKQFAKWYEQKASAVKEWAVRQLNLATGLHSQLKRKYDEVIWLQVYSRQIQGRCNAQLGMQIKQGINFYVSKSFSSEYFQRFDKKVLQVKIFNT